MARYELWKHAWHRYRMVAQNTLRTRGVNQVNNLIFLIHLFSSKATYFFLQKNMIYSNVHNMFSATIWHKYLGNILAHKKLNAKAFCNENKRWVGGRFGLFLESKHLLYGTPRKVPDYYIYIYILLSCRESVRTVNLNDQKAVHIFLVHKASLLIAFKILN